jgi:hypothetical protein
MVAVDFSATPPPPRHQLTTYTPFSHQARTHGRFPRASRSSGVTRPKPPVTRRSQRNPPSVECTARRRTAFPMLVPGLGYRGTTALEPPSGPHRAVLRTTGWRPQARFENAAWKRNFFHDERTVENSAFETWPFVEEYSATFTRLTPIFPPSWHRLEKLFTR